MGLESGELPGRVPSFMHMQVIERINHTISQVRP